MSDPIDTILAHEKTIKEKLMKITAEACENSNNGRNPEKLQQTAYVLSSIVSMLNHAEGS